jgi:diadenosine tetraphosphate (Ap4A) HIT family hydrolase
MFNLHAQLEKDTLLLSDLELCHLRLLPDSDHPWVLLIPKRKNIKEIHQLNTSDQQMLMREISKLSLLMDEEFSPDKINVGALGNMVPQLHVHIICRFIGDRCWPGSIWGSELAKDDEKINQISSRILKKLKDS